MKTITASIAATLAALAATSVSAQDLPKPSNELTTYGSLGYTYLDGGAGAEFGVATARIGVRKGYLGAEVEGGLGVDGDDFDGVHTSLQHSIAAYAVATVPLTEQFQVLARVGYGTNRIKATASGISESVNLESFNFGGGFTYSVTDKDQLRAEYTRYDIEGSGGADGWSISYVRTF